jgi:hypothetical protein
MSLESPISIIYNSDGYEAAITNGKAVTATTSALTVAGSDGTNFRYLKTDNTGVLKVDPSGTTTQPVSGTVTVTQSTGSNLNAVVTGTVTANVGTTGGLALDATLTGGTARTKISDGTNNAALTNTTPGGSEYGLIVRNIPSGTQAVSGTVTVTQATAANLNATVVASGNFNNASVSATGSAVPASATFMGGSDGTLLKAVRVATDGTVRIDPTGTTTQPVSGTVTVTQSTGSNLNAIVTGTVTANIGTTGGLALDATLTGGTARTKISDGTNNAALTNTTPVGSEYGLIVRNIPSGTQAVSGTVTVTQATGSNLNAVVSGTVTANIGTTNGLALDATLTARLNTLGQKTSANSAPVVLASDQPAIPVTTDTSTTSAITSVAASITTVTLLALNTLRKGATFYNDSSSFLYLKLGATASTTSFTVKIAPSGYYEVPSSYTGVIDGIWVSAVGSARITQLT